MKQGKSARGSNGNKGTVTLRCPRCGSTVRLPKGGRAWCSLHGKSKQQMKATSATAHAEKKGRGFLDEGHHAFSDGTIYGRPTGTSYRYGY
jgi:hypothetical protein